MNVLGILHIAFMCSDEWEILIQENMRMIIGWFMKGEKIMFKFYELISKVSLEFVIVLNKDRHYKIKKDFNVDNFCLSQGFRR